MTTPDIKKVFFDLIFRATMNYMPFNRWGDKYVSLAHFFRSHKRFPKNKMWLNDYLFQLKTSDEILNPLRVFTSDKEFVKDYVRIKAGDQYNVPTIAILKSESEIRDFRFPDSCVIKPTHGSGQKIFRFNGEDINVKTIIKWMDSNLYYNSREINYRYLQPKIIVEPFVFDSAPHEDIKFFCYKGSPKVIRCSFDKAGENTRRFFTTDWVDLNLSLGFPLSTKSMEKPKNLAEMISVCEKLCADFEFVRVDMYQQHDRFFVGEITHIHGNTRECFFPSEGEAIISNLIFKHN